MTSDSWDTAGKEGERAAPRQYETVRRGDASEGSCRQRDQAAGEYASASSHTPEAAAAQGFESSYDSIAGLYDPWSRSVTEDVDFYVAEARKAGGPVVELGVGTGRIAVPTAEAGVPVIGVDSSERMLDVCRARAEEAGVGELVDLRPGDLRHPPVTERVALVTCPFRALLHLESDEERLEALHSVRGLLLSGGRFVFDVFAPSRDDVLETHGRWLEREPGIWERADWDTNRRVLTLSVRGEAGETRMYLAWRSPEEWRHLLERAGLEVVACYGWFDLRPYEGGEDSVWIARRPTD